MMKGSNRLRVVNDYFLIIRKLCSIYLWYFNATSWLRIDYIRDYYYMVSYISLIMYYLKLLSTIFRKAECFEM